MVSGCSVPQVYGGGDLPVLPSGKDIPAVGGGENPPTRVLGQGETPRAVGGGLPFTGLPLSWAFAIGTGLMLAGGFVHLRSSRKNNS